ESGRWGPYRQASPPPSRGPTTSCRGCPQPALGPRAGLVAASTREQTTTAKEIPMELRTLFGSMNHRRTGTPVGRNLRQQTAARLQLEALEDRCLPSFYAPVNYAVGEEPSAVAAADFNGDARPDLVVANATSNTVSVLLGNADGTFQPARSFATGPGPFALGVG